MLDALGIHEGDVESLRTVSRRVDDLRFRDAGRIPGPSAGTTAGEDAS